MTSKKEEYYKACGLQDNPFLPNPSTWNVPQAGIWAGYKKEKSRLSRVIKQIRSDQLQTKNCFLMYGNYGTGKTHAMLWAQHQILKAQAEEFESAAYLIRTVKVNNKFGFLLPFRNDVVGGSEFKKDLERYKSWLIGALVRYKQENGIPADTSEKDVAKIIFGAPDLIALVQNLLDTRNDTEVEALVSKVKTDDEALQLFTKMVSIFVFNIPSREIEENRFRKGVYLFIDELDDLEDCTPKERRSINDIIRHLYDYTPENCFCLGLAITAEQSELEFYFQEYVLTRIDRQIYLELLPAESGEKFVIDALGNYRTDGDYDDAYPFDKDAIQEILNQMTTLNPRNITKKFKDVLNHLLLEEFVPSKKEPITVDVIERYEVIEAVILED